MNFNERDSFYEKLYFHELAARDRLDDRFRTLLAIVALVFAVIAYQFNTIVGGEVNIPLLFWPVFAIAIASFAAAIICYIKAWHSQHYQAFPLPSDIEAYSHQITHFYRDQTDERTAKQWADEAFELYMRNSFIEHASFNARANDNKRFWLYYGNSFVISAFAFSVMGFLPITENIFR